MRMNASTHLESKRSQLEYKFKGEHGGEDHIENVQRVSVDFRLPIELHRKRHGVDHNQREYRVLERLGGDKPPDFVLYSMLRYVSANWLGL